MQDWCNASLSGCTFRGRFIGNDFGHREENFLGGSIENCDFTKAILDNCQFFSCKMETIELPRWPCFTVLYPLRRTDELLSANWPDEFSPWTGLWKKSLKEIVAITGYAPKLVKLFGSSEERLREVLEGLSGIVM
jgi:hypothetical protein